PWGTLYATHFLLEAKDAGYHVGDTVLENAVDYISDEMLVSKDAYSDSELNTLCYALYVMSKAGRNEHIGLMNSLHRNHQRQLMAGPAPVLGAAYGMIGDIQTMDQLMAGAQRSGWTNQRFYYSSGGSVDSTLRNLAMRLSVILDVSDNDQLVLEAVYKVIDMMEQQPYRTTQENAFCYMALGKYFSRQIDKGPYSGRVYLGEELLGEFSNEAPFVRVFVEGAAPLRIEMDSGYTPGAAFFSIASRGVPTREAYTAEENGVAVRRQFLTREGGPLDLHNVRQGDLIVMRTEVRSLRGDIDNVAVQSLLPTGLEVENPRLDTTESLPWVIEEMSEPAYQDLRDDRILLFLDLDGDPNDPRRNQWQTYYSLVRAVTPGQFTLPPVQAEAMYDPEILASGETGTIIIVPDSPDAPEAEPLDSNETEESNDPDGTNGEPETPERPEPITTELEQESSNAEM
ncbi:MAG: hypothetical protein D6E12_17070, partial [Desulfovibrio sp.]